MIEREFRAEDDELHNVMQFVQKELDKLDCPGKTRMQIAVATEETFINIAHYAYSGMHGKMTLKIDKEDDGMLTMSFSDQGMPFDPLQKADPDVSLSADERSIGGLGIFMVKNIMDEVTYKYENGSNVLTLRKKL